MKKMVNDETIKQFVLAGKSTFTIKNAETGNRFTYYVQANHNRVVWFVKGLAGPNYKYFGTIFHNGFRWTVKSRIPADTTIVKTFCWFWRQLHLEKPLPTKIEVYHEGICGRCGRRLTVPESINAGYGPVCIRIINGDLSN